jgi:iron complex outermembrane receptor protein
MIRTILAFFCLLSFAECIGQVKVEGIVRNQNGSVLPDVTVSNSSSATITDSLGRFSLMLKDSTEKIFFSHIGYKKTFKSGADQFIEVVMWPAGTLLQDAKVYAYAHKREYAELSASVSSLSATYLKASDRSSMLQSINTVAGVKMDQRSPGSYRISIRGNLLRSTFGVRNVKIYVDGVPFTDASGNTYLNAIGATMINAVDIVKGPAGSMYGSGTGGVMLLSLQPDTTAHAGITCTAGQYNSFSFSGYLNLKSDAGYSAVQFNRQSSDGYRVQSGMYRNAVHISSAQKLSDRNLLKANLLYSDYYYQTPGGLTKAEMEADPRQARPQVGSSPSAATQQAAIFLQMIYASASVFSDLGNGFSNLTGISADVEKFKNPAIRNFERKSERGINLRTVNGYKHLNVQADLGAEFQQHFTNTSTFGNRQGVEDSLQYHDHINAEQLNIFMQARYRVGSRLSLDAGISYNNFRYAFQRLGSVGGSGEQKLFPAQWIPRFGLNARIARKLFGYIQVSKGYSPPSIDEIHASDGIFNRSLNAEKVWNFEYGLKFQGKEFNGSLVAYRYQLSNTIVSRRDSSGAEFYVNAGKAKQTGLEAELNYTHRFAGRFFQDLFLRGSYTMQHAIFVKYTKGNTIYDGNKLTGVAPNLAALTAEVDVVNGLSLRLNYQYTDLIPLNDANAFYSLPYNLLDTRICWKKKYKGIDAQFFFSWLRSFNNVYSLGNDLNAAGNRYFNPAAPRAWQAGCSFEF